jgi:hypothetical protein
VQADLRRSVEEAAQLLEVGREVTVGLPQRPAHGRGEAG